MQKKITSRLLAVILVCGLFSATPCLAQSKEEQAKATCRRLVKEWQLAPAKLPAEYLNKKLEFYYRQRDPKRKVLIHADCITPPIGKFITHPSVWGIFCEKSGCSKPWEKDNTMHQYFVMVLHDQPGCLTFQITHVDKQISIDQMGPKQQAFLRKHAPFGGFTGNLLYFPDEHREPVLSQGGDWLADTVGLQPVACRFSMAKYDDGRTLFNRD